MTDDEQLREALLELEILRGHETERLRETQAILSAFEALTGNVDIDRGCGRSWRRIRQSLGCDTVCLFEDTGDGLALGRSSPELDKQTVWDAPGLLTRPRRIVRVRPVGGQWDAVPPGLGPIQSLVSVPLSQAKPPMVLAALSREPGHFKTSDGDLLERLATVLGQALLRRDLERRNAFLAAVIDRSPVAVTIARAEEAMPIVYVNDAFEGLTGYNRAEILGQNCRFLSAEPKDSPARSAIRTAVDAMGDGTFLLRNKRKDGVQFWNELRLFPVGEENGAPTHMIATQVDVSPRVQAEVERDHALRRLDSALAATSDGFLILGRDGHIRFANQTFRSFLSGAPLDVDALLPRPVAARLLRTEETRLPDRVIDAMREPLSHELAAPDGRQLLVRTGAIPDGGAVVTASDITQVKVNERILRQRLAAIETSQDGIAVADLDGRVIDANPSLLALWGLDEEVMALGRKWTSFYKADGLPEPGQQGKRHREGGVWRGIAIRHAPDGARSHEISLSVVPDVGLVLIVRDVTERLQDAEMQDRMRRQLDRAQMQEHLHLVSAGLAHDFNNLLSAIIGSASVIDTASELSQPARDAVTRIQTAAERAAGLIDGILDLGSRERTPERFDLVQLLASTLDLARGGAPSDVRLTAELPDIPLLIEASQTEVLQVVMNLLVNGIDAIAGASGEVRLSLHPSTDTPPPKTPIKGTYEAGRSYARVSVEDTGAGMTPETLSNILRPYFTTKGNTGSGLGLSVVASIIEANQSLLEIDTEIGRGTRMTVWWPVESGLTGHAEVRKNVGAARAHLPILVLDDAPEVAAAISADLEAAGFETAEVEDPILAIEVISDDPESWGCLVTDYDMPGMNGGDVIERLGTIAPDLPVIVVSALARRLTDPRLKAAARILQKPVRTEALLAVVREAVSMTAPTKEAADEDTASG